jgi:hypothetical protein
MKLTLATLERNIVSRLVISVTILVAFPVIGMAQVDSKAPMATDRQAIERLFTAWNSRDAERVVGVFGDEAV